MHAVASSLTGANTVHWSASTRNTPGSHTWRISRDRRRTHFYSFVFLRVYNFYNFIPVRGWTCTNSCFSWTPTRQRRGHSSSRPADPGRKKNGIPVVVVEYPHFSRLRSLWTYGIDMSWVCYDYYLPYTIITISWLPRGYSLARVDETLESNDSTTTVGIIMLPILSKGISRWIDAERIVAARSPMWGYRWTIIIGRINEFISRRKIRKSERRKN